MDWLDAFGAINYLAVAVATVSTFVVGATWYSLGLLGRTWMGLVGLDPDDMGSPGPRVYVWTAVGSFVAATVLAILMHATGTDTALGGMSFGLIVGFGLRLTAHKMHNDFAQRSDKLTLIDGFHDIVQLGAMGLILGWLA